MRQRGETQENLWVHTLGPSNMPIKIWLRNLNNSFWLDQHSLGYAYMQWIAIDSALGSFQNGIMRSLQIQTPDVNTTSTLHDLLKKQNSQALCTVHEQGLCTLSLQSFLDLYLFIIIMDSEVHYLPL